MLSCSSFLTINDSLRQPNRRPASLVCLHVAFIFTVSCVSMLTQQFPAAVLDQVEVLMQAARELGLQVRPVKETLIDMAVSLIQLGVAKPRPKQSS